VTADRFNFRAWDGVRMWDTVTEILWRQSGEMLHIRGVYDNEKPIGGHADYCDISNIILMQSAGLADKNGVEIFEGDILYSDGDYRHDGWMVVEWRHCGFTVVSAHPLREDKLCNRGVEKTYDSLSDYWSERSEVMGNIHEHPELLECAIK